MGSNNFKNKPLVFVVLFSFLVFHSLILSLNCGGEGSGDYPPPEGGDWIIENDTYIANETLIINGEINITANSILTLNNVTLLINSSLQINGVFVNKSGTLNISDSNLTGYPGLFTFNVLGNMTMEHSKISLLIGGIHIHFNADVKINNCLIYNNSGNAIVCESDSIISNNTFYNNYGAISVERSGPIIYNNTIYENYGGIFVSYVGFPIIWNNTITHNERGIVSIIFSYPKVFGNVISNNLDDGINLELGHIELHDNIIASNGGFGVWSDHTSINSSNNQIYDNKFWGMYSFGAKVFTNNDTFDKDGMHNQDGDVLQEWEILIQVLYDNNEKPHEVHIVIYDDLGNLMYEGDTIGNARTVVLQEYECLNNGIILEHSPFTITVSKGGYKNTTTVEVRENKIITIYLDFEPAGDKTDYQFPFWGIVGVTGIWLIVAIMIIIGLFLSLRERRKH